MSPHADRPSISIVTPSLNQGRFIEETIQSVLQQDYPNIEYVVMDGGSTDETMSILKKYDGRLRWVSEPDCGQSDAINKGWRLCRGEIVAYLNADDTYAPGALASVAETFSGHPAAAMVYGECRSFWPDGRQVINQPPATVTAAALIDQGNLIFQPASFLRRTALERAGGIDPSIRYWMDYDLYIRLATVGPFVRLPRVLANFRVHDEQKSADAPALYREARQISRQHGGRFFSAMFWEHHRRLRWLIHQGRRVRRMLTASTAESQ